MRRFHFYFAMGLVVALFAGCLATDERQDWTGPEPPATEPVGEEKAPPPGVVVEQEPGVEVPAEPKLVQEGALTIQAQDQEARRIAEEVARKYSLQDQQKIAESSNFYRIALQFRDANQLDKAQENARKAVQIWPANHEARKLLSEVNQILIGGKEQFGAGSIAQEQLKEYKVQVEQATIEITNHVRDAERYYNARMYDDAIVQLENAQFKIKAIPLNVPTLKQLLPKVEGMLRRAKNAAELEKNRVEALKRDQARAEAALHAEAEKREILKKIAHLLELAYMSFDQRKYERCIRLCNEILMIDSHYIVARELKEDAEKTRHREEYYEVLRRKIEAWKGMNDNDSESLIPYWKTVRFPAPEEWAYISRRIEESIIRTGEGVYEEDPDVLAIRRRLETMKIDMGFEASTLNDIIAFIRDFTGMNILIDAAVLDEIDTERQITFKVKDLVLKNVLKLLLAQFELDYTVTQEKVVLITKPERAGGQAVLELHDIRDILVQIQDFPGPKVELVAPGAAAGPLTGATFSLDEPKEASVGQEQIVDLIRENVEPQTWEEGDYTIELTPNNQLLVNHTPRVHRQIREFLGKLRSYTGTMVAVTARFVAAYDDWLEDVGVDILNQPAAAGFDFPGPGTDIDDPAGVIGPGFVTNESARMESYDLRAQTFHTLISQDPLSGFGVDPMSGRLVNQGGLGMQYQWIGEQALQTVIRALHKSQKATLVQAPRVTVFNTQRSYIMFLTQMAYIQDLEIQISTAAGAYDPIIGVLTHGAVLDVRPIVSNDRKYVTLEMRPALAEVQLIREVDVTLENNIIQMPWLVLQKVESTVVVPDRGTLMLQGFRDITSRNLHSGVPLVEHIPILNFFFTRKGKFEEKRRLFILVTPEIIDLQEHEDAEF